MAFGKRGGQQTLAAQPAFAVASPVAGEADDKPGLTHGLFGGERSDDFDINLSFMQPYGAGKSVLITVLLWLLLGGVGGHRFYLGNWFIAFAMFILGILSFFTYAVSVGVLRKIVDAGGTGPDVPVIWFWLAGGAIIISLWCFIDGVYVICRMLSAKLRN